MRYFSYRILVEPSPAPVPSAPVVVMSHDNDNNNTTSATSLTSTLFPPAIYAMGPHGVAFALAPSIQVFVNEFILGTNFHMLAASITFYIPYYNIILKARLKYKFCSTFLYFRSFFAYNHRFKNTNEYIHICVNK